MTFQDKLQSLIERIEGNMPQAYKDIMHGATRDLIASGIQEKVLKEGDNMPDFTLKNQDGTTVTLSKVLASGPVILTFYRGFWCPYCNEDLANLNRYIETIQSMGAQILTLSPELPEYSKKIIKTRKLSYDILHDPSNQVAEQVGLKWYMANPLKSLYRDQFNINLGEYHGDDEWSLPMPARILVDQQSTIRYIESEPDYRKRPDPDEVIAVLKSI